MHLTLISISVHAHFTLQLQQSAIVDFPQSVVIAGKYRGYMDCALYILSSYGVKRPHIVLRYKPNFMFKGWRIK